MCEINYYEDFLIDNLERLHDVSTARHLLYDH